MEHFKNFLDLFIHLDHHITSAVQNFGPGAYLIVFLVIFSETGLVILPFLPGDSLLFILGTLAGSGTLELKWLLIILSVAAILGNTVNYTIGFLLGKKITNRDEITFINKKHLQRTHQFYEKYGKQTIIITRFVPIVRTIAPFLAGLGSMSFKQFSGYNIIGGILWVFIFILGGYFLGNVPTVKHNLTIAIYAIIVVSLLPAIIEYLRVRRKES